jgi:hypothetical protein
MPKPVISRGPRRPLLALAVLASCAACGRAPDVAANAANTAASASAEADYQPAPEVTAASLAKGGQIDLAGDAAPGAAVRLASPGGAAQFATADAEGRWTLSLPASPTPRLFSLSMSLGGPLVQAMGYIFVAPDGRVARLREGGGAEALAPGRHGLIPLTLDSDAKRAAALSGLAAPGDTVTLRVDGVERGTAAADKTGRFTLSLNEPLDPGVHAFDLTSNAGEAQIQVTVDAPAALAKGPFASGRQGRAWRVDWTMPGGGEQTTLVFDLPGPSA